MFKHCNATYCKSHHPPLYLKHQTHFNLSSFSFEPQAMDPKGWHMHDAGSLGCRLYMQVCCRCTPTTVLHYTSKLYSKSRPKETLMRAGQTHMICLTHFSKQMDYVDRYDSKCWFQLKIPSTLEDSVQAQGICSRICHMDI